MAFLPHQVRGVLLDLDDTLYDYPPCNDAGNRAAWELLVARTGRSAEAVQEAFVRGREETHREFHGTAEEHSRLRYITKCLVHLKHLDEGGALAHEAHELFWKHFMEAMRPRDGVMEFLKVLRARGVKIAIVSDLSTDIQVRKLAALGIQELIDILVTSEDAGREKPDPAPFLMALKRLSMTPEEVIMVGEDYAKDILGAEGVHITPIYFRNGRNADPLLGTLEVCSFKELQNMVCGE